MKKKFISVAMFCALAFSAPLFVGCSDYDDDISNLQSQIDGLKTSVPTNEALNALQEALNAAKQDLETVKAGKADAQAVKELEDKVKELSDLVGSSASSSEVASLSQQIQDLIEQVNGIDGDLQNKYNEWVEEKKTLEGQIEELNKKIASAATSEEVNTLKADLEEHVKEWNEISTKVEEAAKWVENNGAAIAELTNEVNNIQGIIDAIYGTEGSTVDSKKILAAITALPSYTEQLTALQEQINKGDDSMIQQLASLNEWKTTVTNALIENGFKTQEGAADINAALKILADINKQLNTADENDKTFVDYLNSALKELDNLKLLATQVQSIVFVPSSATNPYNITAERLYILNNNGTYNLVGVKNTNKIKFRVSPASALENFEDNYELSFDGQVITRGNVAGLQVSAPVIDKAEGTVEYTIEAVPTETYAVCAVLKAKDKKDAEGNTVANNLTEVTSNYFVMGNSEIKVNSLYADYGTSTPATGFAYTGENTSIDYTKGRVLKGYISGTSNSVVITDYLNEVTPEYIYNLTGDTEYITMANGILSLKDQYKDQNSMIGKTVNMALKVKIGEYTYNTTSTYTATVERRIVDKTIVSEENALSNPWKSTTQYIALSASQMNAIINETELSRGDFNALIVDGSQSTPQANDVYLITAAERYGSTGIPAGVDPNQIYVVVKAGANVGSKVETKITLKEGTASSTTQTQSYTFRVWVDASDYSMFKPLDVNEVRWGSDNTVKFTPILNNYDHPSTVTTTMNLKDLFDGFDAQQTAITSLGGQLIVTNLSSTVSGVTFNPSTMTLSFDKNTYDGTEIKLQVLVKAGAKELEKKEVSIVVKQVSGKWTSSSKTITANNVNATYNGADGFSWVDFRGKTMWANGSTVATGTDKDFNADPFSLYGLTKPTFSLEGDTYNYLKVDSDNGKITFTQEGKQAGFNEDYKVKLVVKANSPWGEIEGLTNDRAEIEIVVPAGTNK